MRKVIGMKCKIKDIFILFESIPSTDCLILLKTNFFKGEYKL